VFAQPSSRRGVSVPTSSFGGGGVGVGFSASSAHPAPNGVGGHLPSEQLQGVFATADNGRLYPEGHAPGMRNHQQAAASSVVSPLTGERISAAEFNNNRVPFFRGSGINQDTRMDRQSSHVELFTGTSSVERRKESVPAMFQPRQDMTYGTPSVPDAIRDGRYNASMYRQGEKLMQEQRVGPGLDQGYTTAPSGGFQQMEVRDYVMPKTVDELRVGTNPKVTYTQPVIQGASLHLKRGQAPSVTKNRPDRHFANTPDRYFTTTGAVKGGKIHPKVLDKPTHRQDTTREHTGAAGTASNVKDRRRDDEHVRTSQPFHKETELGAEGVRNAAGGERWGDTQAFTGTYGKSGIEILPTERDSTQFNSYLSSAVAFVKEMVKPLEDVMRTTRKEDTIHHPRPEGNMSSGVHKPTVHDPNDVARTTIKETNIHDTRTGTIGGGGSRRALTVHDANDIARTTIKETLIHDSRTGAVQRGPRKLATYDPNDVARTTIKETNIHDTRTGNMGDQGRRAGVVYDPNDIARTTLKETNIHDVRTGNMGDGVRLAGAVYDPNDIAKTTIKETNIHDVRTGYMSAQPSGEGQGGKTVGTVAFVDPAKTTVRETMDAVSTTVNAQTAVPRMTTYDPNNVARTTIKETLIDKERQGNVTGLDSQEGYTHNPKQARNTNRQFISDNEYAGAAAVAAGSLEGGYQVNDARAPPTQRQELKNLDYRGGAQTTESTAPRSYEDMYNARMDEVKEKIAEGRQPTLTGSKALPDKSLVNVEVRDDSDRANQRALAETRVEQMPLDKSAVPETTKEKTVLDLEPERNQPDPSLVSVLDANPFALSIHDSNQIASVDGKVRGSTQELEQELLASEECGDE